MADGYTLTSIEVAGLDGAVRGLFTARMVGAVPASSKQFPGISSVAISPKKFTEATAALEWLRQRAKPGGGAVGVEIGHQKWLVGAWVPE